MAELSFDIGGFIQVDGNIVRYTLPDGRVVRMIMALEVEDSKGNVVTVTSEAEMCKLEAEGSGFCDECGAARDATDSLMGSNHKESCSLFRK